MLFDPVLYKLLHGLHEEVFTSPLEAAGTCFGVANIVLLVRRSIWNYPAGIASVSILAYVFFHTALFSDTLLQIFFIVVQCIGWIVWLRHRQPDGELIVARMTLRQAGFALTAMLLFAAALGAGMHRYAHAAYPFWDATVASASVIGQLLLTLRRLENWLWWIGSNIISIVIYNLKGLHILAALYVFYLVMSGLGFIEWRRRFHLQEEIA